MGMIKVKSRVGDTVHPKYGCLEVGRGLEIDEADFGDEVFERIRQKDKKGDKRRAEPCQADSK
jgi:hypothetical protein